MGDRALIIFKDKSEVSPTVYLHWSGSNVPALLAKHAELMKGREGDLSYAAARFIGICHTEIEGNLSLGVWNTELDIAAAVLSGDTAKLKTHSHGDAGLVVVDVDSGEWKAFGGSLVANNKESA